MTEAMALNKMISRQSSFTKTLKSSCLTPLPFSYISPRLEQPPLKFKSHDGSGCYNLGLMYEKGKGVKQDDFKAVKFFQKACDLNDGTGCSNLGFMYEEVQIPKKRATTARIQITRLLVKLECFEIILFNKKACDLNNGTGCSNLGFMYEEGKGVRKSNTKNLTALKSSCLTPLPSLYINPRLEQPLP
jgi:TPR repeat protein